MSGAEEQAIAFFEGWQEDWGLGGLDVDLIFGWVRRALGLWYLTLLDWCFSGLNRTGTNIGPSFYFAVVVVLRVAKDQIYIRLGDASQGPWLSQDFLKVNFKELCYKKLQNRLHLRSVCHRVISKTTTGQQGLER
jgi:hypothetical protein